MALIVEERCFVKTLNIEIRNNGTNSRRKMFFVKTLNI